MVRNRPEVICRAASQKRYTKSIGEARLMVGNAIRAMCRSPKSRAGCRRRYAVSTRRLIPEYANEMHMMKGKGDGSRSRSFPAGSREARPPPAEPDAYKDEAYRLWQIKRYGK
jgi:hypothetical protein